MNLVRRNMVANMAGQGWIALMGFAFVPLYLKFIGAEGYGLIGFFVVLSASLAVLDAGLGSVAVRETATLNDAEKNNRLTKTTLLSTIERLYLAVALIIGVVFFSIAPVIARFWLNVDAHQESAVVSGLHYMGVAIAIQFPVAFYSGCLVGMQRQLLLNIIMAISATLRGAGAVFMLWYVEPSVEVFFAWQCVVGVITVVTLRLFLIRGLDVWSEAKKFDASLLKDIKEFALGIAGVNLLSLLLTQVDKIILSKILSLQFFGYYMLAWTLGTIVLRLVGPIFNAYYPLFTQLASSKDDVEFGRIYLRAGYAVAVAAVPISLCLIFFSEPLLSVWTQNSAVAADAWLALSVIAFGTMVNAFMHMPYAAQLACGWTRLSFWQNLLAVFFIVPTTYYFAREFGISGAALPWLILNLGYLFVSAPIMYRFILRRQAASWYKNAIFYPLAIALFSTAFFYFLAAVLSAGIVLLGLAMSISFFVSSLLCYFYLFKQREEGFKV